LRAVLAGGLGSEAWVARRLACGGGWDFERGGHRTPRAHFLVDPSGKRLQTYAARAEPSCGVIDGPATDPLLRHRRLRHHTASTHESSNASHSVHPKHALHPSRSAPAFLLHLRPLDAKNAARARRGNPKAAVAVSQILTQATAARRPRHRSRRSSRRERALRPVRAAGPQKNAL